MLAPLVVLAVGSVVAGWVGIPGFPQGPNAFDRFLAPAIHSTASAETAALASEKASVSQQQPEAPESGEELREWLLAGTSVMVALIGFYLAWLLYYKRPELPDRITARIHGIYLMVLHKYYIDEGYGAIFVKPLLALSTVVFWKGIDQGVIDGMVNGLGTGSKEIGNELRRMQSGNIRSYAAWVAAGGAAVIAYMLWWGLHPK